MKLYYLQARQDSIIRSDHRQVGGPPVVLTFGAHWSVSASRPCDRPDVQCGVSVRVVCTLYGHLVCYLTRNRTESLYRENTPPLLPLPDTKFERGRPPSPK